jgi:toxin-antitoxin system PIN domain toxin
MLLCDVNVLVYAHRQDVADHARYLGWLEQVMVTESAFGISELVLSGFVRIVTHPRVFHDPSPLEAALAFAAALRDHPHAIAVAPGSQHWDIFARLCGAARARGNLIADAYLAALAIESGSEWITTDRDYARFPGLRCRHPLD